MTDASNTAVGAVLQRHVASISFFSKKMTLAETRYSTFDRELLAVYLAIQHFRHLPEGRHFHVLTNHKPLTSHTILAPILPVRPVIWTTFLNLAPQSATYTGRTKW